MNHLLILILIPAISGYVEEFPKFLQNIKPSISKKCHLQLQDFDENLHSQPNSWAQQMVDSTSTLPNGFAQPKFNDLGDFDTCMTIHNGDIFGKYCMGDIRFNNQTSASSKVWAICIPNGCTTPDTNTIANSLITTLGTDLVEVIFEEPFCQTSQDGRITPTAITTICVLTVLLVLVAATTCYEWYCEFYTSEPCPSLIKAFSARTNCKIIFRMYPSGTSKHLSCLDGLRCISIFWVIITHEFAWVFNSLVEITDDLNHFVDLLPSKFVINTSPTVDTFFVISGFLTAFGFLESRSKKLPFNLLIYYLHRFLRLTPSFAIVILICCTIVRYLGSGPVWPNVILIQEKCENHWWTELLYIENYVSTLDRCVQSSWYLMVDMHYYLISPIFLFVLWKYRKVGVLLLGVCGLASIGFTFYYVWSNHLNGVGEVVGTRVFRYDYYFWSHTRIPPWIIGVVLGYYHFKYTGTTIVMKKWVVVGLWVLSVVTLLTCILITQPLLFTNVYIPWVHASFASLHRPIWALALSWVIFACTHNYGGPINSFLSLPIFHVINKLNYGIYLFQELFIFMVAFRTRRVLHVTEFNKAFEFWGILSFSTGCAVLLALMVEYPVAALEKYFLGY